MTRRSNGRVDRALDRMMALDSPVYGDERERAVFMESATFGMTVGLVASLGAAVVAAVLGTLVLPAVLLVAAAVPSWGTAFYAKRRGVDINELVGRVSLRERAGTVVLVFGAVTLTVAAMAWTVFTGHGLIELPTPDVVGPDADNVWASMLRGGMVGGLGGALVGLVAAVVGSRRGKATQEEDVEDD